MSTELNLLNQIIEIAEAQDKEVRAYNTLRHKETKNVGISSLMYHLGVLKELMEKKEEALEKSKQVTAVFNHYYSH